MLLLSLTYFNKETLLPKFDNFVIWGDKGFDVVDAAESERRRQQRKRQKQKNGLSRKTKNLYVHHVFLVRFSAVTARTQREDA